MKKPVLTIFYQFDPWQSSIGGIQTVARNFIKYAPEDLALRLVGIESSIDGPVGRWQRRELAGRTVDFLPLFRRVDDDRRHWIPTSVRYALGLWRSSLASDFMHFHRLEAALLTRHWPGHKTLFVHNDIHQQMRSSAVQGILWRRFPGLYFALEGWLLPQFAQVLSCNSESTALYQRRYPQLADRIAFVRNSFDDEVFFPVPAAERDRLRRQQARRLGLPDDTQFLLFAGRLHPQKDPLLLLRSLALTADPRAHLLVAGDGELAAALTAERDRLGLSQRVTLLGSLEQDALAHLHRLASAFVLTSAYEGLPLVVLEALACGTPVVTTDAGETPRLLRPDAGLVCGDRDPATIAAAWDTVLRHPERFPSHACVANARPYSARTVIGAIYDAMLCPWRRPDQLPAERAYT
ncbi:glycosyltransferase family 4 protein [Nodosilinea sp. PGN35]|uniref:glycosyltransferase family 4 protein n=1 Tax=Nodosilinea sp. PGN35 TaxID=3020489 RepID=UPI0023B245E8|nr:glycosyltransferase family 4 protein [Nodosilinea sp. TSF1-S3]MDF0367026.1 glycosyltransferase family 4 protein [Nodosilinea sp. TSF1-S3]